AGVNQLDFRLTGEQDHILAMRAQVMVPPRTAFTLDFPSSARVRPGEHRTFTAQVTNSGNAQDTLLLKVEGNATITPERLSLKPGESGTVQVAYVQKGQGNASSITLSAVSTVTPTVRQEAILALDVGYAAAGGGPQLSWQVNVSPNVTYQSNAATTTATSQATTTAPASGPGPTATSDLPGLPSAAPATPDAAVPSGPWYWGGGVSASIGGALSDYATGSAAYGVTRATDGTLHDTASAQVQWAGTSVTLNTKDTLSGVGLGVNYTRGDYTFGVNASRQAATVAGDPAVYTVGGGVTHSSGVSVTAAQSFGGANTTAFGVSWRRQLGAYSPAAGVYAVHRDDRWGVVVTEGLGYENRSLIARQEYTYDSLSGAQALQVKVNSRQVTPFGVSATGTLNSVQGVTTYALGGQLTYTPDDTFMASVGAAYGSDGFSSRVAASKQWLVGTSTLLLDTQATYRAGTAGADAQLTATIPGGSGEYVLRGLLGVQGGALVYGAGAGYTSGAFRVAAGAQVQGEGYTITGSAAYVPTLGAQVGVDLKLSRTTTGTAREVKGSVGYAADRWNAALIGGYTSSDAPGVSGAFLYGAALGVNVTETVRLTASAQRSGTNTRVVLGAAFTPGGALATPDAVVRAFGGRNAGTADVTAFLDANRNGVRDPGEGPVAIRLNVGPCEVTTDAQGRAQAQVRPGAYQVQLGDGVDAQYTLAAMKAVTVPLKGMVSVLVAVQQTA
ncbi:hypothetical protein, partial [Deinococcus sp.]|uniref:hypothetical protein n=1 Tax=Deinococcus sp. TaxID=47478 RepID=UPI0028699316